MKEKIHKCVCGQTPELYDVEMNRNEKGQVAIIWQVQCPCGLSGPYMTDSDGRGAVKYWNEIIGLIGLGVAHMPHTVVEDEQDS